MPAKPKKRGRGRPRGGVAPGERVRGYPQVTVRLPAPLMARVRALAVVRGVPLWRLFMDAVDAYLEATVTADERRQVVRRARAFVREWDRES
jgi:hypothetical protein